LRDAWQALWRPAITSLSAAGATYLLGRFVWLPENAFLSLVVQTVVYTAYYLLAWMILPNGVKHLSTVLSAFKSFRPKREPVDVPERAFGKVASNPAETVAV
jgi:hypothetical protein